MSDKIMKINEIMQDKNNMEKNMTEAMELVKNLLRERYLSGIQTAAKDHHKKTLENPPREVALCNVLKEFVSPEKRETLDKLSGFLLIMNTAKSIHDCISQETKDNTILETSNIDSSNNIIHKDGIYEIDHQCLKQNNYNIPITELMLFMALARE